MFYDMVLAGYDGGLIVPLARSSVLIFDCPIKHYYYSLLLIKLTIKCNPPKNPKW